MFVFFGTPPYSSSVIMNSSSVYVVIATTNISLISWMSPGSLLWLYILSPISIKLWNTLRLLRSASFPINTVSTYCKTASLNASWDNSAENALNLPLNWFYLLRLHWLVHITSLSNDCTFLILLILADLYLYKKPLPIL